MNTKSLEDIKDEDVERMINDKHFLEMWQKEIEDDSETDGILMTISISKDENEKLIYHVDLDFENKKGTIIAKEIIKRVFKNNK